MKSTFLGLFIYFVLLLIVCLTIIFKGNRKYTEGFILPTALSFFGTIYCIIGYLNI